MMFGILHIVVFSENVENVLIVGYLLGNLPEARQNAISKEHVCSGTSTSEQHNILNTNIYQDMV